MKQQIKIFISTTITKNFPTIKFKTFNNRILITNSIKLRKITIPSSTITRAKNLKKQAESNIQRHHIIPQPLIITHSLATSLRSFVFKLSSKLLIPLPPSSNREHAARPPPR